MPSASPSVRPSLLSLPAESSDYGGDTLPVRLTAADEVRMVFRDFAPLERSSAGSFRWTTGASHICLDQMGRVTRSAIRLRLLGGYAIPLGITSTTLAVNGIPVTELPLSPAVRDYRVLVGEDLASTDNPCLTLSSAVAPTPDGRREVGVPFVELSMQPLPGVMVKPALVQLLLNLALVLAAFWFASRLQLPLLWAALAITITTGLILAMLLGGFVAPGFGLGRSLLPLVAGVALIVGGRLVTMRLHSRFGARPTWLLWPDLLGLLFWALVLYSVTRLFQLLLGVSGLWPLKAGRNFAPLATLAVPLTLFAIWGWAVLRISLGGKQTPVRWAWWGGIALVLLGAVTLPAALKVSVRGVDSLFTTFTNNPTEYISDVARIAGDPLDFLRNYVAMSSTLSLHGSTHPPGNTLLLWAVGETLGPGAIPASLTIIVLTAIVPLAALWVGTRLGGRTLGLLAGALTVVMPGHQIYSVTSMDGFFNGLMALGAVAFLLALEPGASPRSAILAGLMLAAPLAFTYAATQLAFFGLAVFVVAVWRHRTHLNTDEGIWPALAPVLRQSVIAGGVLVGVYLVVAVTTGYNVVAGAVVATRNNAQTMRMLGDVPAAWVFLPPTFAYYTTHLLANLLPFAWYLGPWGFLAVVATGERALRAGVNSSLVTLVVAISVLLASMLLSGLFNREVERIWSFVYPLAAVLIAAHVLQGTTLWEQRWRSGLFLGLFAAHAMAIRVLLNTYW